MCDCLVCGCCPVVLLVVGTVERREQDAVRGIAVHVRSHVGLTLLELVSYLLRGVRAAQCWQGCQSMGVRIEGDTCDFLFLIQTPGFWAGGPFRMTKSLCLCVGFL